MATENVVYRIKSAANLQRQYAALLRPRRHEVIPVVRAVWRNFGARKWRLVNVGNRYFKIVSLHTVLGELVISVEGAANNDGARLVASVWSGATNQQWRIVPDDRGAILTARHSGKVMATSSGEAGGLFQATRDESELQRWHLQEV